MNNEKILAIKELLKQRRTPIIREKLDELDNDLEKLDKLQEFLDKVKKLCEMSGQSNMVSGIVLKKLLVKYGK